MANPSQPPYIEHALKVLCSTKGEINKGSHKSLSREGQSVFFMWYQALFPTPEHKDSEKIRSPASELAFADDCYNNLNYEALVNFRNGELQASSDILMRINHKHPKDIATYFWGHQVDIYLGNAERLLERMEYISLTDMVPEVKCAFMGMYAFALAENDKLFEGNCVVKNAIRIQPDNGWALHAQMHLLHNKQDWKTAVEKYKNSKSNLSARNHFLNHNRWHHAINLFLCGYAMEFIDVANSICANDQVEISDVSDISSIIWYSRLLTNMKTQGSESAELFWKQRSNCDFKIVFWDIHHAAYLGATGDETALDALILVQQKTTSGLYGERTTRLGLPFSLMVKSYINENYKECLQHGNRIEEFSSHMGGSKAQTNIIKVTMNFAKSQLGLL